MPPHAALTDLREMADVTGIGASISDEDIKNAKKQWEEAESETEPPPPIGATVQKSLLAIVTRSAKSWRVLTMVHRQALIRLQARWWITPI
jgi:hypothetical protein